MISDQNSIVQSLLGSLFTWGLTALGASFCLLHHSGISNNLLLDGSLGFSAGVMMAASYWSLLAPAIDMSESMGYGAFTFLPSSIGFALGAAFVYLADKYVPMTDFVGSPSINSESVNSYKKFDGFKETHLILTDSTDTQLIQRRSGETLDDPLYHSPDRRVSRINLHKIFLMILAITVHNIPEGLAVGVAFGAIGSSEKSSFQNARNLAVGIGIQNFPEGLAVSLPLKAAGYSTWTSIWYGQLSGIVEPVAAVLGCLAVTVAQPILPYALAFAAGAMVFVVFDSIVPESHSRNNGKLSSLMVVVGFIVMMALDVGLG